MSLLNSVQANLHFVIGRGRGIIQHKSCHAFGSRCDASGLLVDLQGSSLQRYHRSVLHRFDSRERVSLASAMDMSTSSFGLMTSMHMSDEDRLNVQNPMATYYAQQSAMFAANAPGNPQAQRTAQYWAAIAQAQQQAQRAGQIPSAPAAQPGMTQMHQASFLPGPTAPTAPNVAAPAWPQTGLGANIQAPTQH